MVKEKFFKNQKLVFFTLISVFIFAFFAFFNCTQNNEKNLKSITHTLLTPTTSNRIINENNISSEQITNTSLNNNKGNEAIFKLSKKYKDGTVSNILWKTSHFINCEGRKNIDIKDALNIHIPWTRKKSKSLRSLNLKIEAFIQPQKEECLLYRNFFLDGQVFTDAPIKRKKGIDVVIRCAVPAGHISFSSDGVEKDDFPVGSSVNIELKIRSFKRSIKKEPFQWSIKKVGDNKELADQTKTSSKIIHTFSEIGLYNISVQPSNAKGLIDEKELLIGLCEKEVEAIEVILSEESFGDLTPKRVLTRQKPVFNYVRPADTNSNNKVTFIRVRDGTTSIRHTYPIRNIYKYKRNSSPKFIDINIQNVDECFLDTNPLINNTCPECPSCHCPIDYQVNKDLNPLPFCNGNIFDMSTLDMNISQCTDANFVVIASKKGQAQTYEIFYKHCPKDQDYCYFGLEADRPYNHRCITSSTN